MGSDRPDEAGTSVALLGCDGRRVVVPQLQVRRTLNGQETWVPIWQAQNLPFLWLFANEFDRFGLETMLQAAGQPIPAESALYF